MKHLKNFNKELLLENQESNDFVFTYLKNKIPNLPESERLDFLKELDSLVKTYAVNTTLGLKLKNS